MDAMANSSPRLYYSFIWFLAILGYGYLLLFPLLVVYTLGFLAFFVTQNPLLSWGLTDWALTAAMIALGAAASYVTITIVKARPEAPAGKPLDAQHFPILLDRINELIATYKAPELQHVKLTTRFEIKIVRTRGSGFPPKNVYTLLIGLPVMSCLSPLHLKLMLARAIGHLAISTQGYNNRRIVYISSLWNSCSHHYSNTWSPKTILLRLFFSYYTAFFKLSTLAAVRLETFVRDFCILDITPAEQALESIVIYEIKRRFLEHEFWPELNNKAYSFPKPPYLPYSTMASVADHKLNEGRVHLYYESEIKRIPEPGSVLPNLRNRIEELGMRVENFSIPDKKKETAASYFLGDSLATIQKQLDNIWYLQNKRVWDLLYKKGVDEKKLLKNLRKQAAQSLLSNHEAIKYLLLIEKHIEPEKASPLYMEILKTNSLDAKVCFEVGRLLLAANNQSGVEAMHMAMDASAEMKVACCNHIANYMANTGDLKKAQEYRRMIISLQAEN